MNSQYRLELALKKQRLQFRCVEQRRELAQDLMPLLPVFAFAETVRNGTRWVREHPAISVGVLVAIFVAKPRFALRWARRAWLAWQGWRKLRLLVTTQEQPPQAG